MNVGLSLRLLCALSNKVKGNAWGCIPSKGTEEENGYQSGMSQIGRTELL